MVSSARLVDAYNLNEALGYRLMIVHYLCKRSRFFTDPVNLLCEVIADRLISYGISFVGSDFLLTLGNPVQSHLHALESHLMKSQAGTNPVQRLCEEVKVKI